MGVTSPNEDIRRLLDIFTTLSLVYNEAVSSGITAPTPHNTRGVLQKQFIGPHLLTGLEYSGASGRSRPHFSVVQFIALDYSNLYCSAPHSAILPRLNSSLVFDTYVQPVALPELGEQFSGTCQVYSHSVTVSLAGERGWGHKVSP